MLDWAERLLRPLFSTPGDRSGTHAYAGKYAGLPMSRYPESRTIGLSDELAIASDS